MAGVIVRPYGQPLDKVKISSKETIENQIEGNGKGIASVEKELNPKAETTVVKKKDMEEVQRNSERRECLEKELNPKAETTVVKKKDMEEEVQRNSERKECLEKELNPKAETTVVKKKDMEEVQRNSERRECLEKELKAETTVVKKKDMEEEVQRNTERKECLKKELNLEAETTVVKKKEMEEEVQRNTERIECLKKELDEIRRSKETIIDDLKNKIKALEKEVQDLIERNKELEKQLQEVNERLKKIEEENKEKDARIKKLEKDRAYNQSVLILMQIGTTLQRNMCKYVLGKYFKESFFYKYGKIDDYIKRFVPVRDQESAKNRRKELNENCPWNKDLVDSLKTLNGTRITIAHPELSSENIQQAIEDLREMNEITDEMVENIMELKALWETSEDL